MKNMTLCLFMYTQYIFRLYTYTCARKYMHTIQRTGMQLYKEFNSQSRTEGNSEKKSSIRRNNLSVICLGLHHNNETGG